MWPSGKKMPFGIRQRAVRGSEMADIFARREQIIISAS